MNRTLGTCLAFVAAWLAAGAAKPLARGQDPQAPLFKSSVEVVAIDVSVVDKAGTPLRQLGADQFEVTVDGRPRRVLSAELVDHAPRPGSERPGETVESWWDYSSNERPGSGRPAGRLFYILIDQGSFKSTATRAAVTAAKRFIDRLQPADRVGLVAFPGPGPTIRASTDHSAARIALNAVAGMNQVLRPGGRTTLSLSESSDIAAGDPAAMAAAIERECRGLRGINLLSCTDELRAQAQSVAMSAEMQTRLALAEIHQVVAGLVLEDERKTLVLVSAGLPASDRGTGNLDLTSDIALLARDAVKANANLYVLHLDSTFLDAYSTQEQHLSRTPLNDASITASGLETLAAASGGQLLRVTSDADPAFDRVLRETAASYVLGLQPLDGDRDGKTHAIKVGVKVPGAVVRSRREFFVPGVRPASAEPLAAAMGARRTLTALPLGVSTRTLGIEPNGGLRVLVTGKVGSNLDDAEDFQVSLSVTDAQGRVVIATKPSTERLTVPAGSTGGSAAYLSLIGLPPGDYHLRLAAIDGTGRVGTVDHRFSATLTEGDGGVMMGDLLLVHPARSADDPLAIIPDGRLRSTRVAAHLEVLAPPNSKARTVTFGVADRPDGQLLVEAGSALTKADATGRSTANTVLDLALLPPGDYVAVAIVGDGKRSLGRRYEPLHLERGTEAADTGGAVTAVNAVAAPRVGFLPGLSSPLVKVFARSDVLTPAVLSFFSAQLQEADTRAPAQASAALADLRNGRFDAVLAGLAAAPPDRLSVAFLRGLALLGKGELEPAAAAFRESLRMADDFLPAAFYLGACYAAGGKDEEAVGAWQTALVAEGGARIVYDVLADALLRLQDGAQALDVIGEARERWPDDNGFTLRLAVAQAMQGQRAEAVATLRGYLETHRGDAAASALALRLIFETHAAGGVVVSAAVDREMADTYAEWYRSAGGANQALVARWVAFIEKK